MFCVLYLTAKARRASLAASSRISRSPIEPVHLDISEKVEPSHAAFFYTVASLDDFTAKSDVMFLKNKFELFNALVSYKMSFEFELREFRFKLTNIRMDRARENMAQVVKSFCSSNGIGLGTSPPYAPQNNGAAERLIQGHWTRTIVPLFDSSFPRELWSQTIEHSNWFRNRVPSSKAKTGTLIMKWNNTTRIQYSTLLNLVSLYSPTYITVIHQNPRSFYLDRYLDTSLE